MAFKSSLANSARRVPETDRLVPAAGRKKPAVGCKGHAIDVTPAKYLKKLVFTLLSLTSTKTFGGTSGPDPGPWAVDGLSGPGGTYRCPSSVRWQEPVSGSHSLIVMSTPPDARIRPSAEKATEKT
jgi:hypothetical protein